MFLTPNNLKERSDRTFEAISRYESFKAIVLDIFGLGDFPIFKFFISYFIPSRLKIISGIYFGTNIYQVSMMAGSFM